MEFEDLIFLMLVILHGVSVLRESTVALTLGFSVYHLWGAVGATRLVCLCCEALLVSLLVQPETFSGSGVCDVAESQETDTPQKCYGEACSCLQCMSS